MRRYLFAALAFALWLTSSAPAAAQGCGQTNPNCIVPTRPAGDNGSAAINSAFLLQGLTSATSGIGVDTYGGGANTGKTAFQFTNTDGSALTATERYSVWIGNTSQGTGDATPAGTTFALGLSAIKANWQTTTVVGEFGGLNIAARCGHNNAVQSGDCSALTTNVAVSQTNNFVTQVEGVSGYFPGGSTTGSLFINTQVGSIKATGLDTGSNTGIGFFAQARNGLVGHAFSASNLCAAPTYGTCSKWLDFLNYLYDDGTHTAYNAFNVSQSGQITLAGFGAVNTNQKTFRVGGSATNNYEILNGAANALIYSLTDTGEVLYNGSGSFTANGGGAAVTIGAVTPAGVTTPGTIFKWMTAQDNTGATIFWPVWH